MNVVVTFFLVARCLHSHAPWSVLVLFDIETGANLAKARELLPAFDPNDVAVGNIKDEDKIKAKIEQRRIAHEKNWIESAALRPETGQILAIGILPSNTDEPIIFHLRQSNEAEIIRSFWDFLESTQVNHSYPFAGWSIGHFDLPYLVIRSRILGVAVPPHLRQGRYFSAARFLDLQEEWLMGRPRGEVKASLDYVARALGCGEKSGSGENFEKLYNLDEKGALSYLANDLALVRGIAARLGFF